MSRLWTELGQLIRFLSLAVHDPQKRARILYDLATPRNVLGERSLYLNLGYWETSPQTLDAAGDALAELLADVARFTPDDHVLDAGCGYADQDLFWMERYGPAHIVGLNTNEHQVAVGRRRVSEHQLEQRIRLDVGSATAMTAAPDSFDVVVALESAHHFVTRDWFFHEARRVLRPGGRLVTAEVLAAPFEGRRRGIRDRLTAVEREIFAAWPRENWYSREVYASRLAAAGFERVHIRSIGQHVFPPLMRYLARRLREPEVAHRMNRMHRWRWLWNATSPGFRDHLVGTHDYIVAIGYKPPGQASAAMGSRARRPRR